GIAKEIEMNKKVTKATDQAKKFGDEVFKVGRNFWLAGLGVYSLAEEETRKAVDQLIKRGEEFEKDDKNVVSKTIDQATDRAKRFGNEVEDRVQEAVGGMLHRAGIPSRAEIRTLIDRVEELNSKVEKLRAH
ncbi:MAG TPA: phasin family protein, partial [Candidatus Polarisedimenticolaceae bacterium]|nr:phasin family protein [Candidatus Polarisedimenticolaceae bacterium]